MRLYHTTHHDIGSVQCIASDVPRFVRPKQLDFSLTSCFSSNTSSVDHCALPYRYATSSDHLSAPVPIVRRNIRSKRVDKILILAVAITPHSLLGSWSVL